MPGGAITEHVHPHQEERFIISAGEAHFTLDGEERVVGPGETLVVPAGARHSEANPGIGRDRRHRRATARRSHTRQMHEAFAGLAAEGKTTRAGRAEEPAPARRHHLALPPREPGDLAAGLGPEPHPPAAVGARQAVWRAPRTTSAGTAKPDGPLAANGMRELISSTVPDAMTLQGAEVRQVVAPRVPQIARSRSLTNGEESDSSRRCRSARGAGRRACSDSSRKPTSSSWPPNARTHEIKPPSRPPRFPGSGGAESRAVFQSGRVRCCG